MDLSNHSDTSSHPVIKNLVVQFNTTLLDFMNDMAQLRPKSSIGKRIKSIRILLKALRRRSRYLNVFVENVLVYKDKIDADDESFFLTKDYEDGKKDVQNSLDTQEAEVDMDYLIVEMKEIWTTLEKKDKDIVLAYMKLLCHLAQEYFVLSMGGSSSRT